MFTVDSLLPLAGVIVTNVGTGLAAFTVNPFVRVAVPPPGAAFVTDTFLAPVVAAPPIVIFAVSVSAAWTVTVLTVMFAPKLTVVTPVM
jgi:hypothetical protein